MTGSKRFAEVGRILVQDEQVRAVAEQAVEALENLDADSVSRLAADEAARESFFEQLWDEVVEPLRHDSSSSLDMWRMSMEGVVIDHLIALWAGREAHDWRTRVKGLLAVQPV